MTLAAGDKVFMSVSGGLMEQSPIFGKVWAIDGTFPNVIRVTMENGAPLSFESDAQAQLVLTAFTDGLANASDLKDSNTWITMRRLVTSGGLLVLVRLNIGLYELRAQ